MNKAKPFLLIIVRIVLFLILISTVFPAFLVFAQYWIPYAESGRSGSIFIVASMNLIVFGYAIYAILAIVYVFKGESIIFWTLSIYNLFIVFNYYLQTQKNLSIESYDLYDLFFYGIAFLGIYSSYLYRKYSRILEN